MWLWPKWLLQHKLMAISASLLMMWKIFECPVCLHVTREPNLTSCCGQHFCHYCIQTILSNNKPCRFCKENSFMAFLDKKQKRRVLGLKVYWGNKELCTWFGNLGELEQHLTEKCQFVLGDCSYNCRQMMMRLNIEDHEANYCPKRPHSCEYCQLKGTYRDIQEDHVPVCPKYPVTCPNECKATSLLRAKLKQHLGECPLAMVECELREVHGLWGDCTTEGHGQTHGESCPEILN